MISMLIVTDHCATLWSVVSRCIVSIGRSMQVYNKITLSLPSAMPKNSWCRTHLHALLPSVRNGIISSRRSRDCTGYRSVDFKVALLTYSIRCSGEPQRLNSLLMDYKAIIYLWSAEEHLLVVPRTKLSSTSRAFSVAASKL